jgi:RNA polymerase sigma-70 factor (ECF subfamily)
LEEKALHIHHKLIEKARQLDRKAQGKLYELYNKAMFNASRRIVNDTFLAEDIMHDSFIEAFKKIGTLEENKSFGVWLKRIVVNKSISQLNKKELFSMEEAQVELLEIEEEKEADFEVSVIKRAMKELAKRYRIIFSLYLIEGYDHEEIGEILNISSSTSRSQLSRAKNQLRKIVNEQKVQL